LYDEQRWRLAAVLVFLLQARQLKPNKFMNDEDNNKS
jgi:hypothetical protein